jgi:hypothetical protein
LEKIVAIHVISRSSAISSDLIMIGDFVEQQNQTENTFRRTINNMYNPIATKNIVSEYILCRAFLAHCARQRTAAFNKRIDTIPYQRLANTNGLYEKAVAKFPDANAFTQCVPPQVPQRNPHFVHSHGIWVVSIIADSHFNAHIAGNAKMSKVKTICFARPLAYRLMRVVIGTYELIGG